MHPPFSINLKKGYIVLTCMSIINYVRHKILLMFVKYLYLESLLPKMMYVETIYLLKFTSINRLRTLDSQVNKEQLLNHFGTD